MHALLEKRADAADASVLFFKAGRANFLLLYSNCTVQKKNCRKYAPSQKFSHKT